MGKNLSRYILLSWDLLAIFVAFRVAHEVRYGIAAYIATEGGESTYWPAIMLAMGVWILLFRGLDLDKTSSSGWDFPLGFSRLVTAVIVLMLAILAGSYLARTFYSRLALAFLFFLLIFLLVMTRLCYHAVTKWRRKHGGGFRRVVIVGQSDLAREMAERIRLHPELNYDLVGFLYPYSDRYRAEGTRELISGSEQVAQELARKGVDELLFTVPIRRDTSILEFIVNCQKLGMQVKLIPEYYDLHTSQIENFSIDGIPILGLKEISVNPVCNLLKVLMDYTVAPILLVLTSPIIILVAIILAIVGKGQVLRRETRVGLNGRRFTMYRFDVGAAENAQSPQQTRWKTRFYQFLQRYSISELPQFWNVLKGDMSLVGPRPETPERVRNYSAWHARRLQLKPGITGLAQVRGLRASDSSDLKTKYDLEYLVTLSPLLDLTLIVATIHTLFRRRKSNLPAYGSNSLPPGSGPLRAELT
jgi:exopolysaccharide biosynthesis polyprenyl glycosylphosphotransferase